MTVSVDSSKNEAIIETWRRDYNEFRPHSALDNMTPEEYVKKHLKSQKSLI
ncbi:MAG: transposase, partial [Candidatus Dadabacteria bacterium]|nr:transposase [Candidatus Dadabacteria bacterium]